MSVASQAMIDWAKDRLRDLDRWSKRHRSLRVIRGAVTGFMAHEALHNAGSMAYFAVLSIFQVLVLGIVVLSFFVGSGPARQFIVEQVQAGTPLDRATVSGVIESVISSRGGVSLIGFVLLLWSALGFFSALNQGITRAFGLTKPRPFWTDKLIGLLLMGVVGLLVVASIAIGIVTGIVQNAAADVVAGVPGGRLALTAIGLVVPIVLIFMAFLFMYRVVPNRPVTAAEVWPGAILATVLWSGLRVGFTYYATNIARYNTAFGPISAAISLLVFLYFANVVVLLGAELARANALEDQGRLAGFDWTLG
jgi:membrane protein